MTDSRLDVGESNVAEGEVSYVVIGVTRSRSTRAVSTVSVVITVAGASGDCSCACVVEVNIVEDVAIVRTASSSTVIGEGETLPLRSTLALEENSVCRVSCYSDGVTCTIDGNSLTGSDLDDSSWLNCQISTANGQEVTVRADPVR